MKTIVIILLCLSISAAIIFSLTDIYLAKNGNLVKKQYNIVITTDKDEYKIGEPVIIKMKNIGNNALETSSMPVGFTVYDKDDNQIKTWIGALGVMGEFQSNEEIIQIWDQTEDYSQKQVSPGIYKIKPGNIVETNEPIHEFRILE